MVRSQVRMVLGVALLGLVCAPALYAQPGGGRFGGGPGGFGGPGFGGGGGLAGLLQRRDVQEELELLDDQKQQLTALAEKSRERMSEMFRRGGNDGGNRDELRDRMRQFTSEITAEVEKVLLPHQMKRLRQIEVQSRMRFGLGLGGEMASQLGLSESEQETLRNKARDLEQEMAKKTAELRRQYQEQLIAQLSPAQQAQVKEMVGEPFEFKDEPGQGGPGGPGGFFGGRGQRGGDGGGDRPRRPNN
ncbi:MAG: hypothetical protein AB7F89_10655 [Pirellulaceae bacterium]